MTVQQDPRMRKSIYNLAAPFLEEEAFSFTKLPPETTRHSPYSREFVMSLPDTRFMEKSWGGDRTFTNEVEKLFQTPVNLTPFTAKLVEKTLVPMCISPGVGLGKSHLFSSKAPVSGRFPAFTVKYHPTVGFEASCALLAYLSTSGKFPWKLINVFEVVPSELICFSVVWEHSTLKRPMVIHFWINKWDPLGASASGGLPHVGVMGGGFFALLSRLLAPLNLQVDLTGVIYANLEAKEKASSVSSLLQISPTSLDAILATGDKVLFTMFQVVSGTSGSLHAYISSAGMFHHAGGTSSREKMVGVANHLGLDKTGFYKEALKDPAAIHPSTYVASWCYFGENHESSYSYARMDAASVRDSYLYLPPLKIPLWDQCRNKLGGTWKTSLRRTPPADVPETTYTLRWKDEEVRRFWLPENSSVKTLKTFVMEPKNSPEIMVAGWKELAQKISKVREESGGDSDTSLIRHPHLENLRRMVT